MIYKLLRYLPGLLITAILVLHVTKNFELGVISEIEKLTYDTRVRVTMPGGVDPRIVVVDVDEDSLLELGQWPWPRQQLKLIIDNLFDEYKIAALGMDFVFAEPDAQGGRSELEQAAAESEDPALQAALLDVMTRLDGDSLFAEGLLDRPVTLGYYFHNDPSSVGQLPEPTFEDDDFMRHTLFAPSGSGFGANLAILQDSAAAGGFFSNPLIDDDGITRRLPLLMEHAGGLYESLALSLARVYLDEIVVPEFGDAELAEGIPLMSELLLGELVIPIDSRGAVQVPYRGPRESFPYVSAAAVSNKTVADPGALEGAIVLMGTSAIGLSDLRATPVQEVYPGVEVHANVVAGILDQNFKHLSPFSWAIELASVVVFGLALTFILPLLSPLWGVIVVLSALALAIAFNLYEWQSANLLLPLAGTLIVIAGVYVVDVVYGFFTESKSKRQIRRAFSSYLAPAIVQQLVEDPDKLRLEGESREMTFLFTDLAGFTSFAEKTDAKTLVSLLNEYLDEACQVVMDHGGTIDKIVGDAIHAIYNAPLDQPDHANLAVKTALAMDEFCTRFIEKKKREQDLDFGITRIGVNTGIAVVGNFGGESRFDYTAHGDPINTAARMESVNKHLGTRICISTTTVELCDGLFFRPIASLVLKGKTVGVETFEPLSEEEYNSERVRQYMEVYEAMKNGEDVIARFEELTKRYPEDPLPKLHLRRMNDGETGNVMVMSEK